MLYDPSKAKPVDAVGWALWNAADYIERYGHCKGAYRRWRHLEAMPAVCAIGALAMATDDGFVRSEAGSRLGTFIRENSIPDWNDAPTRTAAEVVAAMRGAALA